ncbi:sterol desaturase family protein [Polyangium spumosum]
MFATAVGIDTVYQFWIHTELVGKLGPLEWVLNTPSHHRVHHGCNGRYLDRNHGGILIVWDRLFGTFEPEAETPVYGTVKPVASWNPLFCTWAPLRDILETAARAPRRSAGSGACSKGALGQSRSRPRGSSPRRSCSGCWSDERFRLTRSTWGVTRQRVFHRLLRGAMRRSDSLSVQSTPRSPSLASRRSRRL